MNTQLIKNITIIGAGNVAYHLCKAFTARGVKPQQLFARSQSKAGAFAEMGVEVVHHVSEIKKSELFILAVNDDSIADAAALLP
ncbi:MAG: NAD(P)-binding domain-containing protein, partial [Bacteroidales bacterium]|nr:NAD(P)-binding domain-containing protein [Bacteroidales bacterium]